MMKYEVVIPDEVFALLEWEKDGLPAVCVVNQAMADFQPKLVFAWHLSIIVDCTEVAEREMPTREECRLLDQIGAEFDQGLKAEGNALFLARITWARTRQFLYRVYDPEIANRYLMEITDRGDSPRPFDFRMEHDEAWEYAAYFLDRFAGQPAVGTEDSESSTLPNTIPEPRR